MIHRPNVRRALATPAVWIVLAYVLLLAYHRWVHWRPGSYKVVFIAQLVAAGLGALVEGAGRARSPALRSGLLVLVLGVLQFIDWIVPNATREAFCDSPGAHCEDGMLFFIIPLVTLVVAVLAAATTGLMQAVRRWLKLGTRGA